MITERMDRDTGAILFKKDKDSLRSEEMLKRLEALEKEVTNLKKEIKKLKLSSK